MYTGSLGAVSNKEDWVVTFGFIDDDGVDQSVAGATISVSVTDEDTPNSAIIQGSTSDGIVVISSDGLTVTWTFPPSSMARLCAGTYAVFARMVLADVTSQIFAGATISIVEGGPS